MITYKIANPFSNRTEYEVFKYNYCENGCIFHKERENDGFPEFVENGGCPIEDRTESATFNITAFPNVLLEIWEDGNCRKFHHCPFYRKAGEQEQDLQQDCMISWFAHTASSWYDRSAIIKLTKKEQCCMH